MKNFVETYLETPKKSQRIKDEPTPSTSTTPEIENAAQLQTPRIPYLKRDPRSVEIRKVANKNSIRIYYQNVQSIREKQKQFNCDLARNYDVIVLTETWLLERSRLEIFDKDFDIYRRDRSGTFKGGYGGVLVAVSSKLYSDPVILQGFDFLEYVCLKLFHNDHFVYIYCLYMPGERKRDLSSQHIKAINAIEYSENDTLIVIGDFNMPGIKWEKNDNGAGFQPKTENDMLQSLKSKQLHQLNNIKNKCGNVLDLVFVNSINTISSSGVQEEHALSKIDGAHPPFEMTIDSLKFPQDLPTRAKEKAYSIRKNGIQNMEQLFEIRSLNDCEDFQQKVDSSELDIRWISKEKYKDSRRRNSFHSCDVNENI